MSQDTMEVTPTTQLRVMTVTEAQREHYKKTLAKLEREGPKIIAGIKNEEGAQKASAWRVEVRDFIRSVESGMLGEASKKLLALKREVDAEINSYVNPCEKLFKDAKTKMDRWYLDESNRIKLLQEKQATKDIQKAEEKKEKTIQTLMDLGKEKEAKSVARKPLAFVPKTIAMPKIENAAWKMDYRVEIEDLGALLKHIAAHPEYHEWIDIDDLRAKLKGYAAKLNGNMAEFAKHGVQCYATPSSVTVGGPK